MRAEAVVADSGVDVVDLGVETLCETDAVVGGECTREGYSTDTGVGEPVDAEEAVLSPRNCSVTVSSFFIKSFMLGACFNNKATKTKTKQKQHKVNKQRNEARKQGSKEERFIHEAPIP